MHASALLNSIITMVVALGFAGLAAQKPQTTQKPQEVPGAQEPVARITTELVQLDIVVTDRDGKLVRDLKREEFQLLEDGKAQLITHFAEGTAARPAKWLSSERKRQPASSETVDTSAYEPRGRYLVLMIDDLHISIENIVLARRALSRFIKDNLVSGDQTAIATTSGQIGLLQQFTRDRAVLERAINRLTFRERRATSPYDIPRISDYQAELIDIGDQDALELAIQEILRIEQPQAASGGPVGRGGRGGAGANAALSAAMSVRERAANQARTKARMIVGENAHVTTSSLSALEGTIRNLRDVPGQKLVILVSDGFFLGGSSATKHFDIRRITDAATKSGVVIYSLDSRGLVATLGIGDASQPSGFEPSLPGVRERIESSGIRARTDGMHALSRDTGGYLVQNTNDLKGGLQRVMQDNEVYYVLAYEPVESYRDGRFRKIEVRFPGRPELKARTRSGYFSPNDRALEAKATEKERENEKAKERDKENGKEGKDKEKKVDEVKQADIRRAMTSLFPLRAVPVDVLADFVETAEDGSVAVLTAHVEASALRSIVNSGQRQSAVEIVTYVFDEKGKIAGNSSERVTLNLKDAAFEETSKNGFDYRRLIPLKPGFYQVRVALRDENSGDLGSNSGWVEVPDLANKRLTLSSIMLTKRTFRTDENADFLVFAYNSTVENGATDLVIQSQVFLNSKLIFSSPLAKMPSEPSPDLKRVPYAARLSLGSFEPGEYELRTMVIDRLNKTTADRRVNFVVGGQGSGVRDQGMEFKR